MASENEGAPASGTPDTPEKKLTEQELAEALKSTRKEAADKRVALQAEKARAAQLEQELAAYKAAEAEAERKKLEAAGEYKKLTDRQAAEVAALKAENEKLAASKSEYESVLTARRDRLLEEFGATDKSLVEELPLKAQVEALEKLVSAKKAITPSVTNDPPNPPIAPNTRNGGTADPKMAEIEAIYADTSLTWVQKEHRLRKLGV